MESLFKSLTNLYTQPGDLAAIWLNASVFTSAGRTMRIAPGSEIAVVDGKIVADADKATHRVVGCFGTLINQFEITVVNIETIEPLIIKL